MGQRDFVLDNLVITEEKDATSVTLESTELYKGETAKIYGNNLDQITWETSNDKVAVVDKEAGVVKALAAGTATLTATLSKDEKITFEITVTDGVVTEIPREEFDGITSSANTEQSSGEPAGSGVASAATDGDSSTYWHSQWSGFTVSKENPAILTVDLGKEMSIGGFKFQQRPERIMVLFTNITMKPLMQQERKLLPAIQFLLIMRREQVDSGLHLCLKM